MRAPSRKRLDRLRAAFAGADADAILQRQNENLAVADASLRPGAARFHNRVDGRLDEILVDGALQLHLVQEVHRQFMASVNFRVPLLPPEAAAIDHGEAKDLDLVERFLDGFDLGRLNDGEEEFHGAASVRGSGRDVSIIYGRFARCRGVYSSRSA